ncbi:hypothetical protein [Alkalilimnicola ehrlichii]|uniref:hypothetical protein n=1 Tax=Alkalilimnicola ehrlichii TaxID=351052 RepID=UPI003BA0C8D6
MSQILLDQLTEEHGLPRVNEAGVEEWAEQAGEAMLLLAGDPGRVRESADFAVVLPELLTAMGGRLQAAVVSQDSEKAVGRRFGVRRWPALVVLRDGGYLGCIEGMRDWSVFLEELNRLLEGPVRRPPSVGIPVSGGASSATGCNP